MRLSTYESKWWWIFILSIEWILLIIFSAVIHKQKDSHTHISYHYVLNPSLLFLTIQINWRQGFWSPSRVASMEDYDKRAVILCLLYNVWWTLYCVCCIICVICCILVKKGRVSWWQLWLVGCCGNWLALGWNVRTDMLPPSPATILYSVYKPCHKTFANYCAQFAPLKSLFAKGHFWTIQQCFISS